MQSPFKSSFKYVCVTMCPLVMSPFSRDYRLIKVLTVLYMCTVFTQSLVLDGRTSILVTD